MANFSKDPDAVLDYMFDWSLWLSGGETIVTSNITVTAGISLDSQTNTTIRATGWISGGTVGQTYEATNRITTSLNRTDDRTISIRVEQR